MRRLITFAFILVLCAAIGQAQQNVPEIDRIRIAEAFKISESLGNQLWPEWINAPFAVLLVTPDLEYLIRHPNPPQDFVKGNHDQLLKSEIYSRKRTQNLNLLATFPFAGVPTIVIGQAENTAAKTSTQWVVTLLHEHFHQLQYSQPNYYQNVNALGLARGDETGMWMLNYPFPYAEPKIKKQFAAISGLLAQALERESAAAINPYLEARQRFQTLLSPEDYRYFSFQIWQEGIARYTEYRIAELAAARYKPSKEFRNLEDFQTFGVVAERVFENIMRQLRSLEFDKSRREALYPFGAGEGLLLDRVAPGWRSRYLSEPFYVEKYFCN